MSLTAVVVSGAVAAVEGNWRRSTRLHLGFATHGGMWGDAVLLPIVNALAVPWIVPGTWLIGPLLGGLVGTVLIHAWWHGGHDAGVRDHLWPTRPTGRWYADLSWSGGCHVVYVAVESALLLAFAVSATPAPVTWIVSGLLTAHVLVGVLQPSWMATGRFVREDLALTAMALAAVWAVAAFKLAGGLA
jgi:uncharacterized protein YndB with AHSA1/START domain